MDELNKHGKLGLAAMRAGIDRKTAGKYRDAGRLPTEVRAPRTWRTREDAFDEVWPVIESKLQDAPEFEAKTLFEWLLTTVPVGTFEPGQLRTLQRRVRDWRATAGPDKEVFFAQNHKPGEAMQTDFTWVTELDVTIQGVPAPGLLCHSVLPYSNVESATVCHSESMLAIRAGVQRAVFDWGHVPTFHQMDNSTAATHRVGIPSGGDRAFNQDYVELMNHLGMKPRSIAIGASEPAAPRPYRF